MNGLLFTVLIAVAVVAGVGLPAAKRRERRAAQADAQQDPDVERAEQTQRVRRTFQLDPSLMQARSVRRSYDGVTYRGRWKP